MIADWLASTLLEFGRRLGLSNFVFSARETASVKFENGVELNFEHSGDFLFIYVTCPMAETEDKMKLLLQSAHPDNMHRHPIRAAYQPKSERAAFLVKLADRDASIPLFDDIFNTLWRIATTFMSR